MIYMAIYQIDNPHGNMKKYMTCIQRVCAVYVECIPVICVVYHTISYDEECKRQYVCQVLLFAQLCALRCRD